jgi:hypothetical protein
MAENLASLGVRLFPAWLADAVVSVVCGILAIFLLELFAVLAWG